MATILIGTEVPEGMGHVAPWLDLCRQALHQNHSVHMAGPDLLVLHRCIASRVGVKIWAAPRSHPLSAPMPVHSWPELIVSLGYAQSDWLSGAVQSWIHTLDAIRPDVVFTDYAPALMVACRALGVRYIEVGGGFCVPPVNRDGSMPAFPGVSSSDKVVSQRSSVALTHLNEALTKASRLVAPTHMSVREMDWIDLHCDAHCRYVLSPAFLDHYDERDQGLAPVQYVGFLGVGRQQPHSTDSKQPRTDGAGKKVVAYLKPNTPRLEEVVEAIASMGVPAQMYGPGLRTPPSSPLLSVSERPLDLDCVLGAETLFVTNGGLGAIGVALHRGSDLLLVPQQAEQIAMARCLVKAGLGGLFWAQQMDGHKSPRKPNILPPSRSVEILLRSIQMDALTMQREESDLG